MAETIAYWWRQDEDMRGLIVATWASSAAFALVGAFLIWQWLLSRKSPSQRNSTARSGFSGAAAWVPRTVAGRRGLIDASVVGGSGLMLAALAMPFVTADAGSPVKRAAIVTASCGLVLFGFGWPLCAAFGPRWLRPWYARDELPPWRGARAEARMSEDEAWLESGARVAEQERRVRARRAP